ncbi:hypothetical protein [Pontibacter anaerobius]|uniref:Outer membrane protein beta-barrel domain-containing protein n=1 Tax=Pontibacter anaerobius TaxID=2993940 RepID=A0ABT3RF21_9BACT|nr:hypothetical protein [Pontibacter anaerobius]MCX2739840.1 hypothetical protein [Pontibacter anaerobius]
MNTDNMPDDELDKLFRKSADSFDPPFDPEAWKAMEKKLDHAPGGHRWWYSYLYPLLLILLTGTGIAVFKFLTEPTDAPEEVQMAVETQPERGSKHGVNSTETEKGLSPGGKEEPILTEPEGSELRGEVALKSVKESREKNTLQRVSPPAAGNSLPARMSFAGSLAPISTQLPQPPALPLAVAREKQKPQPDSSSLIQERKRRSKFLSSLQITLLAAPDVTTVKFTEPDAISTNTGLLVAIPLTNRFSVVTGVLWADKVYKAKPDDYAPSPDYWDGQKNPSSIDAACRVLDLPLNIRYKLFEGEKSVVSMQAGLSSYIMLDEEYTYNYTYGTKPYSKTKEISHENEHWLGIQNISASYNRKLSPALSVGVEPFVKIPLSGIGNGNVKLTSAGIFITASYTIPLKR